MMATGANLQKHNDPLPSSLKISEISELGSLEWLEKHETIFLLSLQALRVDNDKDKGKVFAARYGRVAPVLVHEVVLIRLWRECILPHILEDITPSNSTDRSLVHPILVHEIEALGPLMTLVGYASGPDLASYMGQASLDLVDYCLAHLTEFLSVGEQDGDDFGDLKSLAKTALHWIYIGCLKIMRHMIAHLEDLGSDLAQLILATDAPMILTELLLQKPWTRLDFKDDKTDIVREVETDAWLCLCLLFGKVDPAYELTEGRRKKLLELRPLMDDAEDTLKEIGSPLRVFREFLDRLPVVTLLPTLRKELDEQFQVQKEGLIQRSRDELRGANRDIVKQKAFKIQTMQDPEVVEALLPPDLRLCTKCGDMADMRCKHTCKACSLSERSEIKSSRSSPQTPCLRFFGKMITTLKSVWECIRTKCVK